MASFAIDLLVLEIKSISFWIKMVNGKYQPFQKSLAFVDDSQIF